jgi:hypothetical protein
MTLPKVRAWQFVKSEIHYRFGEVDIPPVPPSSADRWDRERAWRRTVDWAREHNALDIIEGLKESDFHARSNFNEAAVTPDDYSGEVGERLLRLCQETGWTKLKRTLVLELQACLLRHGYITVQGHGVRYRVSHVGGSFLYYVHDRQQGHLRPFRGKTVRVVCVGSGSRTDRTYMIGTDGVKQISKTD